MFRLEQSIAFLMIFLSVYILVKMLLGINHSEATCLDDRFYSVTVRTY